MNKIISLIATLLFIGGCAQPKPPQWYYQENGDPQVVCGFGSGGTISDAKQQAQGDLASRVGVKIGARFQSNVTSNGEGIVQNKSSDVLSENLFKEMIDVSIARYSEESSWGNHLHFVEACISKLNIKTVLERSIEKQMAQLNNTDLYGQCLSYKSRQNYLQLIIETSNNVKLISQYDGNGEYLPKFEQLAQMQAKAKRSPSLMIKSNDAKLSQLIVPMLAKYGILISNGSDASGVLSIDLKGDVVRDPTATKSQKNYLYVARVVFRLDNGCESRLYEGSFKTVDQAKTIQYAKSNALNKLVKGVENSSLSAALSQY